MVAGRANTDDVFETLLRRTITDFVIGGMDHRNSDEDDLIVRLRHYELRAREER
ncbi:hypothetical protein ACU4GA_29265 [Methylobacterium oryzae CBMB20]